MKAQAQYTCSTAEIFCSSTVYTNSTQNNSSGMGTSFGCITNASSIYLYRGQAKNNGSVTIQVIGNNNLGLICWGNATSYYELCTPVTGSILACSSSTLTTESITFNIVAGKYYLFAITSPSSSTQFTVSQTAGNGILCIDACSKQLPSPTICYVTSNNNLKNEIYFNNYVNSFKTGVVVLRENGSSGWDSIGYVQNNQPDKFIDTLAISDQQSYRYALAHWDSCGYTQSKSIIHKTILLQSGIGTNGQVNLSWNSYQGVNITSYYIYRGNSINNLQLLNMVSGSTNAYTDLNPLPGTNYYKIAFKAPSNCTSNAINSDTLVYSNYKTNPLAGVNEIGNIENIDIYPNPADNDIHIKTSILAEKISIIDLSGKEIFSSTPTNNHILINVKHYPKSVYFIRIQNKYGISYKKFVIN